MNHTNNFNTGDILLINLGELNTSEIIGREQGKTRPCIVIKSLSRIGLLIVVPLTGTKPNSSIYYKVEIENSSLDKTSYALCHQIRTLSIERVIKKLGDVDELDLDKIQWVLYDLLDLN